MECILWRVKLIHHSFFQQLLLRKSIHQCYEMHRFFTLSLKMNLSLFSCMVIKIIMFAVLILLLQAVEESLKSVNLYHGGVADKQAGKYSGGMKRRLSVAISLIGDPKVCLNLYFFSFCVVRSYFLCRCFDEPLINLFM